MRIGIDARYLSHGLIGGVHTYVAHFVPALAALAPRDEIFLYADTKRPFELSDLPPNVTVRRLPWRNPLSSLGHDLGMHRQMARDRLDLAHFPANYGFGPASARTVVTLHDAMNLHPLAEILRGLVRGNRASLRGVAMSAYLHWCTGRALAAADLVMTDSAHAAAEIAARTGLPPDRIVAVPLAPSPDMRPVDDEARLERVRARYDLAGPFVLADALKHPELLVAAWQRLPADLRAGRRIVFFSRRPDPRPAVAAAVEAGQASLLVRPPREDLAALYSLADAFVFPSWLEGFGLPILEAMACGAPVIASDRGSIPEVAGDAALLADAEDVDAFSRHIASVLASPAEAARLRQRGFAQASRFSWSATAAMILAGYRRAGATDRQPGRDGRLAAATSRTG